MARGDRLARLDAQREELEVAYIAALIEALEKTAKGKLALFGHKVAKGRARPAEPEAVTALLEMGEEIDAMRDTLQIEAFALHAEFLASRGPVSPSAVGEPKQAQMWLERLKQG